MPPSLTSPHSNAIVPMPHASNSINECSRKSLSSITKQVKNKSKIWYYVAEKLSELSRSTHVPKLTDQNGIKKEKQCLDAVMNGDADTVLTLLSNLTLDSNYRSKDGFTVLQLAAIAGHEDIAAMLLLHGANINATTSITKATALYLACENNRVDMMKLLISHKADLNKHAANGMAPLHISIKKGNIDAVKLLLKKGCALENTMTSPAKAWTPLMFGVYLGQSDIVELLLDLGADPDFEDDLGNTPLHVSCAQGHYRVTYLLLTAGADPDMPNEEQITPFDEAKKHGHNKVLYLLETNGMVDIDISHTKADPADRTFEQDVHLSDSLARNRPEIAEIIVKLRLKYLRFKTLGVIVEETTEQVNHEI